MNYFPAETLRQSAFRYIRTSTFCFHWDAGPLGIMVHCKLAWELHDGEIILRRIEPQMLSITPNDGVNDKFLFGPVALTHTQQATFHQKITEDMQRPFSRNAWLAEIEDVLRAELEEQPAWREDHDVRDDLVDCDDILD